MYLKTAIEMGQKKEIFDPNVNMLGAFKKNFKSLKKEHPNFGSESIGYEKWWTRLVTQVLSEASRNQIVKKDLENIAKRLINKYETDECWEKFKKTDELIDALRKEKKVIGVISNFDSRLHNLFTQMELLDFHFVITSYEAKCEKPDAQIFQLALKQASDVISPPNFQDFLAIKPSESLHIGNERENDSEAAKNAGWSSVLIAEDGDFKDIEEFYKALKSEFLDL
jgi:REG-2-like HAD superfamily hydrolase